MALALFDLDNTLLNGDSDHNWGLFLAESGVVDADAQRIAQDKFYADYVNGTLDIHKFLAFQFTPLKENSMADLIKWRADYFESKIAPLLTPSRKALLEKHRDLGDDLVIITATNTFITRPIADALGVDVLIGTDPEQNIDGFTGKVDGIPCFQAGKIDKLEQWLESYKGTLEGSYFYSDSYNDLPLLEYVETPIVVTPDDRLRAHAIANNWQIIDCDQSNS